MTGSPKTLREAILSGLEPFLAHRAEVPAEVIESRVREFLAQKFTAANLGEIRSFDELWEEVTRKDRSAA